ncbi:unnamed protein product [Protopolystoma xenopodis]|uniref:Uncharacterized protein n=1 Tax=Protopolystoma xenopodis TaxID=117903 RepID=A0A448WQ39_9PLAT|nr:unnamed protein product [Protopolystoma xenopodis]
MKSEALGIRLLVGRMGSNDRDRRSRWYIKVEVEIIRVVIGVFVKSNSTSLPKSNSPLALLVI